MVITHKLFTLKKVVGERLDGCLGERGNSLPKGAQTAQQDIGTVPICGKAEFATQLSEPKYSFCRPMLHHVKHELGSE